MYTLCYTALTHPGRVAVNNEDNFYIDGSYRQDVNQPYFRADGRVSSGQLTAAVCDGMGGEALGEEASLIAVEAIREFCGADAAGEGPGGEAGAPCCSPLDCINEANNRICARMREEQKRIGSTIALMNFKADTVQAWNMGDSRIYRLRGEAFDQFSVDHTVMARMLKLGQITREEAEHHPLRHQITQYLGIFPEEMVLEPAFTEVQKLSEGDRYLMCSDGLTDMLSDKEIAICLKENRDIKKASQILVQKAVDAGGRDNITVLVIEACRAESLIKRLADKLRRLTNKK